MDRQQLLVGALDRWQPVDQAHPMSKSILSTNAVSEKSELLQSESLSYHWWRPPIKLALSWNMPDAASVYKNFLNCFLLLSSLMIPGQYVACD